MTFPSTDRLCRLFNARVLDNAALSSNRQHFVVSVPTTSHGTGAAGEFVLTPGFDSLPALEAFIKSNMPEYICLDVESRELGAMPDLFWK
jgi:hypothetical protein